MHTYATIIIHGNAIFTSNDPAPFSGFIAVKNDTILKVGSDQDDMSAYIGSGTKVIDANNRLVLPGFHDFHIHLWLGSMFETYVSLTDCLSEEAAAKKAASFANENPDDPWVLGFGWHHVRWPGQTIPTRNSLDPYIPDRPVLLLNEEAHSAWVNTKALEVLHITKDTKDTPFGKIEKDKHGEPTGFLYETAVQLAVQAFDIPRAKKEKLMDVFLQKAASLGVTSVGDMLPLPGFELGDPDWYAKYEKEGKLTTRVHFLIPLNEKLDEAKQLRDTYTSDKLRFSGLKQFIDGVPLTYTGYMLEPYSDRPNERGGILFEEEQYARWIAEADREGFRVRLHACGDGAVRLALDWFEEAQTQNGKRDSRHTIEHIEVIHLDDIARFSRLGVIASMQPEHLASDSMDNHPYIDRLGPERVHYTWPIRSLEQSGAQLAFGSDFPIVDLNPLPGIYRAVTRKHGDGTPENGWNPEQRITLAEALIHYTKSSAYANFREHDLGTLEAGKKADIVILDRNLFTLDEEEILWSHVDMTMMDGNIIYTRVK